MPRLRWEVTTCVPRSSLPLSCSPPAASTPAPSTKSAIPASGDTESARITPVAAQPSPARSQAIDGFLNERNITTASGSSSPPWKSGKRRSTRAGRDRAYGATCSSRRLAARGTGAPTRWSSTATWEFVSRSRSIEVGHAYLGPRRRYPARHRHARRCPVHRRASRADRRRHSTGRSQSSRTQRGRIRERPAAHRRGALLFLGRPRREVGCYSMSGYKSCREVR